MAARLSRTGSTDLTWARWNERATVSAVQAPPEARTRSRTAAICSGIVFGHGCLAVFAARRVGRPFDAGRPSSPGPFSREEKGSEAPSVRLPLLTGACPPKPWRRLEGWGEGCRETG